MERWSILRKAAVASNVENCITTRSFEEISMAWRLEIVQMIQAWYWLSWSRGRLWIGCFLLHGCSWRLRMCTLQRNCLFSVWTCKLIFSYEENVIESVDNYTLYCWRGGSHRETANSQRSSVCLCLSRLIWYCFLIKMCHYNTHTRRHTHWVFVIAVRRKFHFF